MNQFLIRLGKALFSALAGFILLQLFFVLENTLTSSTTTISSDWFRSFGLAYLVIGTSVGLSLSLCTKHFTIFAPPINAFLLYILLPSISA